LARFSIDEREFHRSPRSIAVDAAAISTQQAELATEALSGGAVEEEVDGVVGVHEQFGGGQGEADTAGGDGGGGGPRFDRRPNEVLDERGDNESSTARQSCHEEAERNCQQRHDQACVRRSRRILTASIRTSALSTGTWTTGTCTVKYFHLHLCRQYLPTCTLYLCIRLY